ncbi:hypothetical protein CPB84DRAFT_1844252 [Gymnopilus junonius]|uniref:Uncharacterized protein n=1 Tax=Gymnopilus junonius TaxID=109634 RepID=A0A9P5NX20_GYMJU|nr:hypothetical protein CPB84DRAFT_1844252 [Gymnopilus junonius]
MAGFTAPGATGHLLTFLLIALPHLVNIPQGFSLLPGGHPLVSFIHLAGLLQVTIVCAAALHPFDMPLVYPPGGAMHLLLINWNIHQLNAHQESWEYSDRRKIFMSPLMPPSTVSPPFLTSANVPLISELAKPVIPLSNHLQAPAALAGLALPPPLLLCLGLMTKCEDDSRSASNRENVLISSSEDNAMGIHEDLVGQIAQSSLTIQSNLNNQSQPRPPASVLLKITVDSQTWYLCIWTLQFFTWNDIVNWIQNIMLLLPHNRIH